MSVIKLWKMSILEWILCGWLTPDNFKVKEIAEWEIFLHPKNLQHGRFALP